MTEQDIAKTCTIINFFGTGEHPYADPSTFKYFEKDYIQECLDKAIDELENLKKSVNND